MHLKVWACTFTKGPRFTSSLVRRHTMLSRDLQTLSNKLKPVLFHSTSKKKTFSLYFPFILFVLFIHHFFFSHHIGNILYKAPILFHSIPILHFPSIVSYIRWEQRHSQNNNIRLSFIYVHHLHLFLYLVYTYVICICIFTLFHYFYISFYFWFRFLLFDSPFYI